MARIDFALVGSSDHHSVVTLVRVMKSKKKTRTERIEHQVASMELLATVGELPPRLQLKLIELKAKLTRLYHGAAKRQMRGLVVRQLHETPPFERHEIDRTEPTAVESVKMVWWYPKSSKRVYNAVIRGGLNFHGKPRWGFGIRCYRMPIDELPKPRLRAGKPKKALPITQQKIEYRENDDATS